jgi:hypothetical protein
VWGSALAALRHGTSGLSANVLLLVMADNEETEGHGYTVASTVSHYPKQATLLSFK